MLFDTGTGLLGTNMFAYCDNNPVNKVDASGMWGQAVHVGYGASYREHRGISFGTYTWATQLDFSDAEARAIADGNYAVDKERDAKRAGFASIVGLGNYNMSWHINNTFNYINPILTDTREWRALGYLIDLDENIAKSKITKERTYHLGYALHPIQDMAGHGDDYVKYSNVIGFLNTSSWYWYIGIWNHGYVGEKIEKTYADAFASVINKEGISYYHWDDVIWTRDLTYDLIGRYHKHWYG